MVAYRLLTGSLPFEGANLADLSHQILYAAPVPPGQGSLKPLEPDLEAAVVRLLDKSLQERTASAEELLQQLGHRGRGDRVLVDAGRPRMVAAGLSLDRKLTRGIFWRRLLIVVCVLLYLLPTGVIVGSLMIAGMVVFARAKRDEREGIGFRARMIAAAFLLLGGAVAWQKLQPVGGMKVDATAHLPSAPLTGIAVLFVAFPLVMTVLLSVLTILFFLVFIFLPAIAGTLYATLRRLERERVLRNAAMQDKENPDRYLEALRESVDRRFEDVGLHLKYAEALYARGRVLEAAVEARLLLLQDPYHFNGNLLLANAYHDLGLLDDGAALCDRYLEVSGYCFEFSELREQCRRSAVIHETRCPSRPLRGPPSPPGSEAPFCS